MINRVHLCDCMDFMRDKPDKAYDLAIVDPPYGIGDFLKSSFGNKGIRQVKREIKWNDKIPGEAYFTELHRISINQIIWGCNYYAKYIHAVGRIVFDKTDGGRAGLDFSDCDLASNSQHRNIKVYRYKWMGIMGLSKEPGRIHPCQKPVALYKWLLTNYAKPGQTIFDSHVGSGSSRIACHDLGFDFEGCELDEDYWKAQEERYQNHIKQPELFKKLEIQKLAFKDLPIGGDE